MELMLLAREGTPPDYYLMDREAGVIVCVCVWGGHSEAPEGQGGGC